MLAGLRELFLYCPATTFSTVRRHNIAGGTDPSIPLPDCGLRHSAENSDQVRHVLLIRGQTHQLTTQNRYKEKVLDSLRF